MANGLYAQFKENLLNELHDMNTDDIRSWLGDSADYSVNLATNQFYSSAVAGQVALSSALTSPTIVGGVFDTADFTWSTVTGDQSEHVGLVNYNGNSAASDAARQLIAYYDTGITGMPVTPNGGNINVTVNASGWFAL
jgi:hypothetical protein